MLWTALGVFFASQLYLAGSPWKTALAYSLPRWYAWGVLAPGVIRVDRILGKSRSLAERVAWHVPIGIGWTCLCIALRLVTRPLRGSPPIDGVWPFFLERFYWDLLIYCVIAGAAIARDYAAQIRDRDNQAHRLALKATDLERRLVEASLLSLRAQLHPHFLFNSLNTISAFTETDPKMARRLMERLGDLLRASLKHASGQLVTLADELTFLEDYLAIESSRFEGRFIFNVHADDSLLSVMVPGFLFQPLVENSIRHELAPRLLGGHVDITVTRSDKVLKLRVRDDGVGLPRGWNFQQSAGIGLRNVASRLEHLYGRSDLLKVERIESGGVDVQLYLPMNPT